MAVIWETTDRLGRTVALTDEGWAHIIARHGDLTDFQHEIKESVDFADELVRDATYAHREIHYRRRLFAPQWLRVVVHYHPTEPSGWVGSVVTAHLLNIRPRNEVRLWPVESPK